MNRFYLKPNLKPEFKLAQPLPVFRGGPTAARGPADPPEAVDLRPGIQPGVLVAAKAEPFIAAVSNAFS
jgi:hypothetical protein